MSESQSFSKPKESTGKETSTHSWGRSPHSRYSGVSSEHKFKDLDAQIDAINTDVNALVIVDALIRQT